VEVTTDVHLPFPTCFDRERRLGSRLRILRGRGYGLRIWNAVSQLEKGVRGFRGNSVEVIERGLSPDGESCNAWTMTANR
jgi:hypothetical protein